MDKKTQKKIDHIMLTCDDDYAKHLKQEAIAELNYLKLIDLSIGLDAEREKHLHTNLEVIAKTDAKLDAGGIYSASHRTKLMLAWTNSNYMNLGVNLMKAGH